ncbi:hypothetical protein KZ820_16425 [Sphingomonas sp. RRHST34]|uniref:Uncharacterized protein n=1 Tax=Sphingomonas citri TaxID=2862499 RepID=A0ABS7BRU6_9SPHN|nr:hypothetical protein [Sphingomonas citri]MBW6532329.1 hypothetical protein [Sphingomonas citri]
MVGKRVRGALYIHRDAIGDLSEISAATLSDAVARASDHAWNVARLEPQVVGLMQYEDFDLSAFPALLEATRVNLKTGKVSRISYRSSLNPLILHRKELLLNPADVRVKRWAATTRSLDEQGAFRDNHRIGRAMEWSERLAKFGLAAIGDEVRAA